MPLAQNSVWQDPTFSPWMVIVAAGLGISMAGMWSGMDDDKNLNANENEVGFGEMLNVLYSRVVIWNLNLQLGFPLHEGARNRIKVMLLCQLQLYKIDLYKKYLRCRRLCLLQLYSAVWTQNVTAHFPLSPPRVLSSHDSIDITNFAAL